MESTNNPFLKDALKLFNFRFPRIQNIIHKFHLTLSVRNRKKELKQFQAALNEINATFLNRYQFKYGYIRSSIISDINLEVLKRLMDKKESEIDELKQKVTAKGVTYLVIYQTCIKLLNSFYHSNISGQNVYSETLLDLIQFSLEGLAHEKLNNYTSWQNNE